MGIGSIALTAALILGAGAAASVVVVPQVRNAGGATIPSQAVVLIDSSGIERSNLNPLPTSAIPLQENIRLVAANVAATPATAVGGTYIYSQTCDGYGSLNLEVLGPDGATWQTMMSTTQSDTAGGQIIQLGSNSVIRVEVAGTAGCAATASRVPA